MDDVKGLVVWQKGIALCRAIYDATAGFPPSERYGLTGQMRRAAVAIASNLAEGRGRGGRREYRQFVTIARGSAAELETQIIIAKELRFLDEDAANPLQADVCEVSRMLNGLARSLDARPRPRD